MFVSCSELSWRCSIQRESLVTGAKAMLPSFEGSGAGSELVRTKRSRSAAECWPGSTESYRENGASVGSSERLRGPVRRSMRAAMFTRQESAASLRSTGLSSTRASFSASAKVAGETSGPTAGPVPKAEGAPGGSCDGTWASALRETAAPKSPSDVFARNCLRESGMSPPQTKWKHCIRSKTAQVQGKFRLDAGDRWRGRLLAEPFARKCAVDRPGERRDIGSYFS